MKEYAFRYSFYLFICLSAVYCNKESGEQEIGSEYLASEDYRQFEQQTNSEIEHKKEQLTGIADHLKNLSNCGIVNVLSFPFVIDQEDLTALQKQNSGCNFNSNNEEVHFTLSMLGKNTFQDIDLYWVLVDWESMHTDKELLAVTVSDDSLRSFKTVGIFKKNLSRDINTEAHAELTDPGVQITSVTIRKILYPIEQNNTVITEYRIDPQGTIREL